jgi:8-oxo-dGTP pyrophosphatase MutT (NUDIX family)
MYKVFIDNACVVFKKNEKFSTNVGLDFLPHLETKELHNFASHLKEEPRYFKGQDPLNELQSYFSNFNWIEAAGGVVKNNKLNKHLFIFRNGTWDLPKGKIEPNESPELAAVREVQEECGVGDLRINGKLLPSFHVYNAFDKFWIKKTHWFEMITPDLDLKPQTEEGISKVEWFDPPQVEAIKPETFASLLQVIDEAFG